MLDLKIVNGTIVNGSGGEPYAGAVGIRGGRIVAVGKVEDEARRTIDAEGKVIAPGFIDSHTHYDAQAFWDPTFSPSCFHGVTTVVGGFCGFSIAPLTPDAGKYLLPMLARVEGMPAVTLEAGVPWDWSSFGEYLDRLEGRVLLNAGFFVGHSAVRRIVMGERANRDEATAEEIEAMKTLVNASLSEGALGFSTTVSPSHNDATGNPVPSRFAAREELLELARQVRNHPGTSLELLPNIMEWGDDQIDLLVDFSLAGGRTVNWNVLVVQGADEGDRARAFDQLRAGQVARDRGAEVIALTFASAPSIRVNFVSGFVLDSIKGWAPLFRLPLAERLAFLRDPASRATLLDPARPTLGASAFGRYRVVEGFTPETRQFEGKLVEDIAREQGKSAFEALIDIVVADELKTSLMLDASGEDAETYRLRAELWHDDLTVVGASDAGAHMDMIDTFAFSTLLLGNAREYGVMTLPEAVRQLTSVPARVLGITDRGMLQPGMHADVVIFDPETVARGPVYTRYDLPGTDSEGRLYAEAVGVDYVIVNGTVAVDHNVVTDERPGTVMRSGRDTYTRDIPALAAA